MSETLKLIMKHWTAPFPEGGTFVDLPFNVEAFCREMDERLAQARAETQASSDTIEGPGPISRT
jgi:hypothetical protein